MPVSKRHQPLHLYLDDSIYFLTALIHSNEFTLNNRHKQELLQSINKNFQSSTYKLYAFSILNNHYHLLFKSQIGRNLPTILKYIHGYLSYCWNKEDNCQGRKIWQNYWDRIIRDDKDFWIHFNYIHNNPIKHGLVADYANLKHYPYSSYPLWLKMKGEEWLMQTLTLHSITSFIDPNAKNKILKN